MTRLDLKKRGLNQRQRLDDVCVRRLDRIDSRTRHGRFSRMSSYIYIYYINYNRITLFSFDKHRSDKSESPTSLRPPSPARSVSNDRGAPCRGEKRTCFAGHRLASFFPCVFHPKRQQDVLTSVKKAQAL